MRKIILFTAALCSLCTFAQVRNSDVWQLPETDKTSERDIIRIPGFDNYQTLKCDFHIHTVFSDGRVWPETRVTEAWQQGLDAIAITDHIEYKRHKKYIQGDHNAPFDIANKRAEEIGFILIKGTEITRKKPEGHMNALFLTDANLIDTPNPEDAVNEAIKQGAFILWNHPGWPDNKSEITPFHQKLLKEKKIHGIEVHNFFEYYPRCIDWCMEMNLAVVGNSDIHEPISMSYGGARNVRPLTLVFAKEKNESSIKEALFAGRTASWYNNLLIGKEELVQKLFHACVNVKPIRKSKDGKWSVEIENNSDLVFIIETEGNKTTLPANKTVRTKLTKKNSVKVTNILIGENKYLETEIPVK